MRAACLPSEARALSSRGAAARPLPCGRAAAARRCAVRTVAAAAESGEAFDARAFRRALGQSENYTRKHMRDEDAAKAMEEQGVGAVSAGERRFAFRLQKRRSGAPGGGTRGC
jgi:hypothetical protein